MLASNGQRQELLSIAARQARNRADDTLLPKIGVRKGRNVAHVDAAREDRAALAHRLECLGNKRADWRKDQCGVQRLARAGVGRPCSDRAQTMGEGLRQLVAGLGEGIDPSALPDAELAQDMRRRPEPVKPDPVGRTGELQRTVSYQPRAKQRRQSHGVRIVGQRKDISGIGHT